jgi:hypothetical protein
LPEDKIRLFFKRTGNNNMIKRTLMAAALAAALTTSTLATAEALSFSKLWTRSHLSEGQVSEIPAFDPKTNTLWVAGVVGVDVLDALTGQLVEHIDVTPHGFVNSVAISNGLAAFAIEAPSNETEDDRRSPGKVLIYNTHTRQPDTSFTPIDVGALPDMLVFSHDGRQLLVANEGTPNNTADADYTLPDPSGSVTVIDIAKRRAVATVEFGDAPVSGSALRLPAVTGMDYEPEYITIARNGKKAFVTLQEANGVAVIDLLRNRVSEIIGLGLKDFSLADNGFGGNNFIDPNDRDYLSDSSGPTRTELRPVPVKGLYQPDAIASYVYRGKTFLVMANEGDTREDDADKARASILDGTPDDLKRLNISLTESTPGNLVTFGARSFSIRDAAGNLVYDSGSLLDAEAIARGLYDDARSDDKGVEPEGVALLKMAERTYAFIGLERTKQSAVAVFDVTNPYETRFLDMILTQGDVSPEGLAAYQYRDEAYLAIANEVSNTTSLYRLDRVTP